MFQDLTARRPALEEMDRDDIERSALEKALESLIRINTVGNGAGIFWPSLLGLLSERPPQEPPLRVLDVGCGGGDMAYRLEGRARKLGFRLQVDGCDRSPVAIQMARTRNAAVGASGTFFELDVVSGEIPEGYDVVISSLFLHHLDHEAAPRVLKKMAEASRQLLLVSDLIRSRFGLFLVYIATRTLSRSPVVHTDGVTSLLAACTTAEVSAMCSQVGLEDAIIERRWPERFILSWRPGP